MIVLTDVATKLEEILNSEDCPTDFSFVVKSQGYHLDSIADKRKGINIIPVFLTMVGGEYNPVPNLKQANFTYGVDIWFPVRFKETFYRINEYLENVFVGKKLEIGGKVALCNIGVAEYGEIVEVHLDQFEEWVEDTYVGLVHLFKKEHDISEEYMNMHFNIFATILGDGFMFGNDVKYELSARFPELIVSSFKGNRYSLFALFTRTPTSDVGGRYAWLVGAETVYTLTESYEDISQAGFNIYSYTDNEFTKIKTITDVTDLQVEADPIASAGFSEILVWDSSGTGASISPVSQQIIGKDKFVRNITNITNFNKSIVVYVNNNHNSSVSRWFWERLLKYYNLQMLDQIQNLTLTKIYTIGQTELKFEYKQIMLSLNENVELGSPLSFTIAFGDGE